MKYLVVGLGNPGIEYSETRHNIGFKILDAFANASGIFFEPNRLVDRAVARYKGREIILIKPTTYMNLSGKAVNYWMQKEHIPLERTLILTDDIALPFGKLRIRAKGSDGGHNGLKDIQGILGNSTYTRLRFGVGSEFNAGAQVDYVLGTWNTEEKKGLTERMERCISLIKSFVTIDLERTMNVFNNT